MTFLCFSNHERVSFSLKKNKGKFIEISPAFFASPVCLASINLFLLLSINVIIILQERMSALLVDPSAFLFHGSRITNCVHSSTSRQMASFKAHFGVIPEICSIMWSMILTIGAEVPALERKHSFVHLLWGLLLLKVYSTEEVLCGKVGVDPKTFREHAWFMIRKASKLKPRVVSFHSNFFCLFYFCKSSY